MARNIRRLRVMRGVSQEAFAVDAGIDRTYVSRLERGLENPTVAVLERIALALEADITELFVVPKTNDGPPPPLKSGRKKAD
ncbi:helix-turn-helix domain-containing protein [Acidocella sp.]|uniref:helix-turn-helix domain-containing protein n=1 Tax=Acidocella sp. TaxID=50710 RepID=UPI002F3FDE9D